MEHTPLLQCLSSNMLYSIVALVLYISLPFPSNVLVNAWTMAPQSWAGRTLSSPCSIDQTVLFAEGKEDKEGNGENLYSDFALPDDIPSPSVGETSVDWDAEWKKVVQKKENKIERPGKDFYKSEAEIAAIVGILHT